MRETGFGPVSQRWQRRILTTILLALYMIRKKGYLKFIKLDLFD